MDIKKLLLEGCDVSMGYKHNKEDWVGEVRISIFAGDNGIPAKVCITGNIVKDFGLEDLDAAINYFKAEVFCYNNLWYKHDEALRILLATDPEIDLDVPMDSLRHAVQREQLISKINK